MLGWNPQKPAKQNVKDTTAHSHHSYILCHFANYAPKKTFCMHLAYSHPLNEHGTQHCSLHSFPHKRQSISMFSSNKISQHNLKLPIHHTDPVLLTVSAYKTELCLLCPVATTLQPPTMNTLSMHINTHYTLTTSLPTAFTTLLCTQLTNTKHSWQMAQDVEMV